jgi:5-methylthioribose kinase
MEENDDINDDFFQEEDENLSDAEESYLLEKMLDTLMVFNSHFAQYIRESNPELFEKAIDYAKTFTEEDVPGIMLYYSVEDKKDKKDDKKD